MWVVIGSKAPHFQQTVNVGGLPPPQLGQMGRFDKPSQLISPLYEQKG